MISAKLYRAICGRAEGWEGQDEPQADFNGSAKIALIGIGESRRAWGVLMEVGRATADGVPAQAVRMLEALEADVRERFPRRDGVCASRVRRAAGQRRSTPSLREKRSTRGEIEGVGRR